MRPRLPRAGRIQPHSICQRCNSTKSPALAKLNPINGHYPSPKQLDNASRWIAQSPISFLFSCSKLPNFPPDSSTPEIAFLGRSNVGKSSLLNALLNRKNAKLAHESRNPGRTKTMNLFGVGPCAEVASGKRVAKKGMSLEMLRGVDGKGEKSKEFKKATEVRNKIGRGGLVVVDCPGYGFGSRGEWGEVVMRYLQKREQLARAFLLVDCTVGLKESDAQILKILRDAETPFQIVLSKVDKILFPLNKPDKELLELQLPGLMQLREKIIEQVESLGPAPTMVRDVLCTSSTETKLGSFKRIGIQDLQYTVLDAAGLIGKGKEVDEKAREKEEQDEAEYHGVISWDKLGDVSKPTSRKAVQLG